MKSKIIVMVSLLTLLSVPAVSTAELKPEDAIKYRQSGMMFMRWNMGKIKKQVVKRPETYNKENVIAAAKVIAATANSGLGALFASNTHKGEGWHKTRIKPEYFEQPDEVKKRAMKFNKEANKLVQVANTGEIDLIKEQFEATFKACKGCHKKFRKKKKK